MSKRKSSSAAAEKKIYLYVRLPVRNRKGTPSTVSISLPQFEHLVTLAESSTLHPTLTPRARVAAVCRDVAHDLCEAAFTGKLSAAVREKALKKMRGSVRRAKVLRQESPTVEVAP